MVMLDAIVKITNDCFSSGVPWVLNYDTKKNPHIAERLNALKYGSCFFNTNNGNLHNSLVNVNCKI